MWVILWRALNACPIISLTSALYGSMSSHRDWCPLGQQKIWITSNMWQNYQNCSANANMYYYFVLNWAIPNYVKICFDVIRCIVQLIWRYICAIIWFSCCFNLCHKIRIWINKSQHLTGSTWSSHFSLPNIIINYFYNI